MLQVSAVALPVRQKTKSTVRRTDTHWDISATIKRNQGINSDVSILLKNNAPLFIYCRELEAKLIKTAHHT